MSLLRCFICFSYSFVSHGKNIKKILAFFYQVWSVNSEWFTKWIIHSRRVTMFCRLIGFKMLISSMNSQTLSYAPKSSKLVSCCKKCFSKLDKNLKPSRNLTETGNWLGIENSFLFLILLWKWSAKQIFFDKNYTGF